MTKQKTYGKRILSGWKPWVSSRLPAGTATTAGRGIVRREELLTLTNNIAITLLEADPEHFETALAESMERMGTCLDMDSVGIWRAVEKDDVPSYSLLYQWLSPQADQSASFQNINGSNIIPRMPEWDRKLFNKQGYLSETATAFSPFISDMLCSAGVRSVIAFPAFFHGQYWGFVSFENKHGETRCTPQEASILKSTSLLLINAVERYEVLLQMNERISQQQFMTSISTLFISKEPMDSLLQKALERMGAFMKVTRVLVAVFEKNTDLSHPHYAWFSDPKYAPAASQEGFSGIIKALFPQLQSTDEGIPCICCHNAITYEGGRYQPFHERGGIRSFICAPIYVDGELWGVISVEEQEHFRSWSESDTLLVTTLSIAVSSAVGRDVIEKERATALDQALAASRAKGNFLSNMSHEMRTPMNAIIGMTVIGKAAQTLEKKDYAFQKIDDASKHLLGVINDVLDMSKIEANKLELSIAEFSFESMLQKVVSVINFRLDERKQRFFINIDKNIPPSLIGDDQRLSQVITNLLSNAVKFTPEKGAIHLDAHLESEENGICRLLISVTDTGIGISGEQQKRLFHIFEQAEAGTSRKYGGTGLGLAISRRIVTMMDGNIWVDSTPGEGSQFSFTVALKRGTTLCEKLPPGGMDWGSVRILAVDDEPEVREFFTEVSASYGFQCQTAANAEEAIALMASGEPYDLYFLDWKLPDTNGIEFAQKALPVETLKTDVILFSAADWIEMADDALKAGMDKFLPKPLFPSSIEEIILAHFQHKGEEPKEETKVCPVDFKKRSILLAEDMEINREIVRALLEPMQLSVYCAENGVEALRMFSEEPGKYDLILMDMQMPEIDGVEATIQIRGLDLPRAKEIPIVAMTANVFREDVERCLAAGMNAHIGKPVDIDEMTALLSKYI